MVHVEEDKEVVDAVSCIGDFCPHHVSPRILNDKMDSAIIFWV
jgi:hypothetical protein